MKKLIDFLKESYEEMNVKVSWPSYSELQSSSILVLVASLIFALFVGLIDAGFKNIISWFYSAF